MTLVTLSRSFAWSMVGLTVAMLLDNYLTYWMEWPGAGSLGIVLGFSEGEVSSSVQALLQGALYLLALALAIWWAAGHRERGLRQDANAIYAIVAYLVRAAFWAVFLVGVVDVAISFLRVEGMLTPLFGSEMDTSLGLAHYRAPYIHLPLIVLGIVLGLFTRTLGFQWLALLVVVAELGIVFSRFVFSYEQAFMADLVRFWYAALFLFASAYTLLEDGHVRVDVLYSRFNRRRKGRINVIGTLVLGIVFCWVILILGTETRSSVINGPLISVEVTQSGFGMYVKYMMAGFLGFFAITMLFQFSGYLLDSLADARGEEGSRIADESDGESHGAF